MDVSIIIINYNTFELTNRCIQSVLDYTKNITYEIILVDNASTECSPEDFKKSFVNLVLIKSSTNVGFAKGNNLGIEQAKGKYILLLNSDAELLNNSVHIVQQFLESNPEVAVTTGKLMYPDGRVQHNCQRFPSIKYQLIEFMRLQKLSSKYREMLFGYFFDYNTLAYPDWVWGTYFMFRKSVLDELPNRRLADDFFMYGEDMQWCKDFSLLGYKVAFLPGARIKHLMGGSGAAKTEMMKANEEFFLRKYYSWHERFMIKLLKQLLTFGNA